MQELNFFKLKYLYFNKNVLKTELFTRGKIKNGIVYGISGVSKDASTSEIQRINSSAS